MTDFFFNNEVDMDGEDFTSPSFDTKLQSQLTMATDSENNRSAMDNAAMFIPAVLAKTVDTFVSSMPGVDENYMQEVISTNMPTIGDYIKDNPSAVGITSDILGSFVPAGLAVKAVRTGSALNKVATRTFGEGANRFFSTGLPNAKLFKPEFEEARRLMKTRTGLQDISAITSAEFAGMKRKAIVTSVKDVLIENVAADAAIYATMNSSDFLFPEETSFTDHLVFFGGTNAVIGGAAALSAKYTMTRGINETVRRVKGQYSNPDNIPMQAVSSVDNRGGAIASWQMVQHSFSTLVENADASVPIEAIDTMRQNITAAQSRLADEFTKAAADAPIPGVTNPLTLRGEQLATLQGVASEKFNNTAFNGLRSLEEFDPVVNKTSLLSDRIAKDKFDLQQKRDRYAELKVRGSISPKLVKEIKELEITIADNEQTSAIVFDIDNTVVGETSRRELWQDGPRKIASLVNGQKALQVDDLEFVFDKKLGAQLPAHIVDTTQTASSAFPISPEVVMQSIGVKEKDLLIQMRSPIGGAGIVVTPELRQLREHLPATFTVFTQAGESGALSLVKKGKYTTPITVARENIFGAKADGKLIGSISTNANVSSATFAKLPFKQMTAIHDGMQAIRESINPDTVEELLVTQGMHHTQLDAVHALITDKKVGQTAMNKIKSTLPAKDPRQSFPDTVLWHSLRSKHEDFQRIQNENIARDGLDLWSTRDYSRALNLPVTDDRIVKLFQLNRAGTSDLIDLHHVFDSLESFKQSLRAVDDVPNPYEQISFIGSMHNMPRDRQPVVGLVRTTEVPSGTIGRQHLQEKQLRDRQTFVSKMQSSSKSGAKLVPFVGQMAQEQAPLLETIVKGVPTLMGGTEAGGMLAKVIGTQGFNNRMDTTLQAVSRFTDITDRVAQHTVIQKTIIEPHKPVFQELTKRGNEGDYASFSQGFNSLRAGWHIKKTDFLVHTQHPGVAVDTGKQLPGRKNVQFVLEQTAENKAMWRERFGEDMPENALVPISKSDKRPLTVTETAFNGLRSIDSISQQQLREENALLAAQGKPLIKAKAWHMPVPNIEGKSIAYLMDMNDNIIQTVVGATPREAKRLAERAATQYKNPLHVVGEDTVAAYARAKGRTFQDISDMSNPIKQTAASKGSLSSPIVSTDPRELKFIVDGMISDLAGVVRRARVELLRPELSLVEFQKVASGVGRDVGKTPSSTIWDNFKFEVLGVQRIDDSSVVGRGLLAIEHGYDRAMQRFYDLKLGGGATLSPAARAIAKRQFNDFNDKVLPEFNPFNDFNDYLSKTAQISLPQTLRKNAGALNEIVTATAIRIFDVGMGVINVMSLGATLPPVIAQLARQSGETGSAHLKRVGAYGDVTPGGLAKLNPVKTVISATHWMWNDPEAQKLRKLASDKGYFDQFAAEQIELYGRTGEGFVTGLLRDFTNKASWITDKSEIAARGYSFMNFAYVGKKVLGLDDEAAVAFAHIQANNVIADFRPSNRPLMFQGAGGMPIGLFTTYMWNYLQRMYSMVETKQMGALISQVGLQTAFFGAESVPGVQGFISTFTENYDGSYNLVDNLNERFGHDATSFLLNGSVSSITGISFGPRASVGIPGTRLNPLSDNFYLESAPAFTTISKAAGIVNQSWDRFAETGNVDPAYMAQVFARANINKGTSNAIELMQGFAEDTQGNLIEEDTRADAGFASRALGFKPLLSDEFRQENRRNTATDAKRTELKDRLAESLRTDVRHGNLTSESLENALGNYIRAGGDPEQFRQFFKSQIVRGTQTKYDQELAEALKASYDDGRLARLLALLED